MVLPTKLQNSTTESASGNKLWQSSDIHRIPCPEVSEPTHYDELRLKARTFLPQPTVLGKKIPQIRNPALHSCFFKGEIHNDY